MRQPFLRLLYKWNIPDYRFCQKCTIPEFPTHVIPFQRRQSYLCPPAVPLLHQFQPDDIPLNRPDIPANRFHIRQRLIHIPIRRNKAYSEPLEAPLFPLLLFASKDFRYCKFHCNPHQSDVLLRQAYFLYFQAPDVLRQAVCNPLLFLPLAVLQLPLPL